MRQSSDPTRVLKNIKQLRNVKVILIYFILFY